MPNYQQGKIYKIVSNTDNELCYVGSTTRPLLCQRMEQHRSCYKRWKSGKKIDTSSYILLDRYGIENCRIELIEMFPCNSKDELTKKEGEWIKKLNCVNRCIAGRSRVEWRMDNPEYQKKWHETNPEYQKKWHEANPNCNKEYQRNWYNANCEKYTCACGSIIRKKCKNRHEKTLKHINYCASVSVVP